MNTCLINPRTGRCSKKGTVDGHKCVLGSNNRCKKKQTVKCAINPSSGRCSKKGTVRPNQCKLGANGRCKKKVSLNRNRNRLLRRPIPSRNQRSRGRKITRNKPKAKPKAKTKAKPKAKTNSNLLDTLNKTCRDYIMFSDENIRNYLAEDSMNFVTEFNGIFECQNLDNLKTQHKYANNKYQIWYECRVANPALFKKNTGNVKVSSQFVKMGSANMVVRKPSWYPKAKPRGTRIYKLIKNKKIKALVSKSVTELPPGGNIISSDHCNHLSDIQTYKLVEIN